MATKKIDTKKTPKKKKEEVYLSIQNFGELFKQINDNKKTLEGHKGKDFKSITFLTYENKLVQVKAPFSYLLEVELDETGDGDHYLVYLYLANYDKYYTIYDTTSLEELNEFLELFDTVIP